MSASTAWFEVDREGLGALVAGREPSFVLHELLSNAFDEPGVTRVDVTLDGRTVRIEDDAPEGFTDLRHAFTLFAPSRKRANAEVRGRFNLGEKLVLALAERAEIATTSGTVVFDREGRHASRAKRERGSSITVDFRRSYAQMSGAFQKALADAAGRVLAPPAIVTTINGRALVARHPVKEFEVRLPTVLQDGEDGAMRRTERVTRVRLYEPLGGETASIYEMGIPVVETGDRYHYDIGQKVPLNQDRDNVTPAFLQRVRAAVLNETHDLITATDANAAWVRDAIEREDVAPEAVTRAVELRFGEKRVIYDPNDREANALAVVKGYTVIPGGALSKASWESVRRSGAALPAGQVTPSPKPYSDDPNAPPVTVIPRAEWTPGMRRAVAYAEFLAGRLLGTTIFCRVVSTNNNFAACFGDRCLDFNVRRLGHAWFSAPLEQLDQLLLHEFAHHFESNHLSQGFHDAICKLGAALARVAREDRRAFKKFETVKGA